MYFRQIHTQSQQCCVRDWAPSYARTAFSSLLPSKYRQQQPLLTCMGWGPALFFGLTHRAPRRHGGILWIFGTCHALGVGCVPNGTDKLRPIIEERCTALATACIFGLAVASFHTVATGRVTASGANTLTPPDDSAAGIAEAVMAVMLLNIATTIVWSMIAWRRTGLPGVCPKRGPARTSEFE